MSSWRQLDKARGAEFDRLFLTAMIKHHEGAVTMVDQLMGSYGAAQDDTSSSSRPTSTPINPPKSSACRRCSRPQAGARP